MVNHKRDLAQSLADDTQLPMTTVRRTALSLAVAAALPGAMMMPQAALAQDNDDGEDAVIEEIVTTGFRGSLRNSMLMKQNSDSIVEAVSAEDIGKLPDASIAEALARLPGLTVQRLNGRGQQLSVRGLGPDFTTALLNGREQVSTGDNRGVEFDQYPSELLSSVIVYKTPDASLIGAGLAGTADMRTIRPLAHGRQTLAANIRYEWTELSALNAGSADDGERATISYVDQFMDDTLGVALGLSHMSNPGQEERYNAWGFPADPGASVIGGAKPYVRSAELERTGWMGVLEYNPTDTVSTALDVYYSTFNEEQLLRGIELPLFWSSAQLQPGFQVENGIVTAGQFNGVKGVMRNDVLDRDSELLSAGFNVDFDVNEDWTANIDLSVSMVDRYDIDIETYSGTGPSGCAQPACDLDELGFVMTGQGAVFNPSVDYTSGIVLTSPQGWGGNQVPGGQVGYNKNFLIEDELNQINLSMERELGGAISSIEFGANIATREKNKDVDEVFLGLAGGALEAPIPNPIGITDLSFLGIPGMISYDPLEAFNSGIYTKTPNVDDDVVTKSWVVEEDVTLAYVQFGVDTEWGDIPVQGNFGVQVMNVDQSSSAFSAPDDDQLQQQVGNLLFSGGTDWTEVLPSLNLTFDFGDDNYIRFALARTVARARMDQMRASFDWNFNEAEAPGTDAFNSPWGGGGGNPEVEPWIANSFDLSYEKYFADGAGYWSLAYFYKDLEQFIVDLTQVRDFTGFPVPVDGAGNPIDPGTNLGTVNIPTNGEGGSISGFEIAFSLNGEMIHDSLSNFGIVGNYSQTDSKIKPYEGVPDEVRGGIPADLEIAIPGLSEEVANLTLYYENDSFSARISNRYRSDFLGEVGGFGGGRAFKDIKAESLLDAQISYNFSGRLEGLSLLLQGFNLTDEPLITFAGDDNLIIDYQRYGSSYMIGAAYTFE